jgi:hypothetical protein
VPLWLAGLALKLSPLGKILKAVLAWLWRFLCAKVTLRVWMIVAVLAWGWHWHGKTLDHAVSIQKQADDAVLAQTVANYRAAAEKARQADAANKARVEAEQRSINERTSHDYEARLAAARALAERLRHGSQGAAYPGAGGTAPVPGVSSPAAGSAQAPGNGLPVDTALLATEQAIQLDELISWVIRQHAVDPNNEPKP